MVWASFRDRYQQTAGQLQERHGRTHSGLFHGRYTNQVTPNAGRRTLVTFAMGPLVREFASWHQSCSLQNPASTRGAVLGGGVARSRGMVQVHGVTYRVDRVAAEYRIVRIADETLLGRFRDTVGTTVVCCADVDETLARTIAREAIRKGKTTWRAKPPTNDAERFALLSLAHWMGVRVQFRRS